MILKRQITFKLMKHISSIKYILLMLVVLGFTSCEQWLDINTNPDKPTINTVDQALPIVLYYSAQLNYDHAEYGVYLSNALTTGGRAQVNTTAYKGGWEFLSMNRHPQWRRHYFDIGTNNKILLELAAEQGARNYELIGRTLRVHSTLLTTDAFGDMPRSNAYTSISPTYDTQEDVYKWMEEELDALLALYDDPEWISNAKNPTITEKQDRMFGGDLEAWRAYTKALKARLLIRKLPNWDNTATSCAEIIAAVDDALSDPGFVEPLYRYSGGSGEQNSPWSTVNYAINAWESRANNLDKSIPTTFFAYAILGAYDSPKASTGNALDPRADLLMNERAKNGKFAIRYLEANIGMDIEDKITFFPDLYATTTNTNPYTLTNGYLPMILWEELMFIKAEAQYWSGDVTAAYNTTKEATVYNIVNRFGFDIDGSRYSEKNYERFFEIKLPGESTFTIADLMQQKYVAMYMQPEQWTDVRRYNYSSKENGIKYNDVYVYTVAKCHDGSTKVKEENFSIEYSLKRPFNLYEAYWVNSICSGTNANISPNAWIQRINYDPETEERYNVTELQRLGAYKNPDWLKKRMIWAKKNNSYVTSADPTEWM